MGKRELVALLNLSSWCLVMVERLFLAMSQSCLQFVIVVFPDHTHLLFWTCWCGADLSKSVHYCFIAYLKISVCKIISFIFVEIDFLTLWLLPENFVG